MKRRDVKLYNIIFPVWLLWLFPLTWIVVLPGNFLIDLLVTVVTMKVLHVEEIKFNAKKSILYIWIFGFVSDFIGVILMFAGSTTELLSAVNSNPFENIYSFLWTAGCIILSAICIYFFNKKIALRKTALSQTEKKKLSLSLAICTAPYLFYLPTIWIY